MNSSPYARGSAMAARARSPKAWCGCSLGIIAQVLKVTMLGVLIISVGWVGFVSVMDDALSVPNRPDMLRGPDRILRILPTPAAVIKPSQRPPYREYLEHFNLRQCECRNDWKDLPVDSAGMCRCRGICPSYVTPEWLTQAHGQALCSLEVKNGFNCYAECTNEKADVKWFAIPCDDAAVPCDESILAGRNAAPAAAAVAAAVEAPAAAAEAAAPPVVEAPPAPAGSKIPPLGWDPKEVYDLRGLQCQLLNGVERCFYEDAQGRELCPEFVTSEWLAFPKDQYLCSADMAEKYYCTVGCQEGNEEVRWGANEVAWCYAPENAGSCPKRQQVIPRSEFKLKEWDGKPDPVLPCQAAAKRGEKANVIPNLTMGMLTHEPRSMRDSLATYDKLGLFDLTNEFLVYVNKRRPEVEEVLTPYVAKYGSKFKVMGDSNNYGIARGMTFLTGNATNEYILFLERDFQLIEPATCVYEQLLAGISMVKNQKAHVVRYRHRLHPGRPNWAERMFRGHEDDAWKGGQPNLFCNVHYWIEEPHKRWPDKFWVCNDSPVMYCSDSYFCNWTNNPQLWSIKWWNEEYVAKFDSFKRNDPWYDLEVYMNWEPNSWNDRKFTVAQGDGLFKHVDRGNFGV